MTSSATSTTGYKFEYAGFPPHKDEALQRDALTTAGSDRIFVDKASGELDSRPALTTCWRRYELVTASSCGGWTASAGPSST